MAITTTWLGNREEKEMAVVVRHYCQAPSRPQMMENKAALWQEQTYSPNSFEDDLMTLKRIKDAVL